MREVTLICPMDVQPLPDTNENGESLERKQLVFQDMQSGEILVYKMEEDMTKLVSRKLKMSNKALLGEMQEALQRAKAQALLAGNGGIGGLPGGEQVVKDILSGSQNPRRT